ncbi:CAP-Gly domain-containing linker protein 4 [Sarcoptes scabiei]|uniref:CAP-GLY domain containing linker protein-like protein 2 n=1 Tax=Sarcoptes scabiei TaxID=52283 RepID=A0A132A1T5_SARSC|nr:CAP-Gly domain-containing linker protein 4 [Sarcoptes scabiei]KPM04893.1 CAP-GLY domain containing linker protein-like protein 2 [Sarcoptes scabiei]
MLSWIDDRSMNVSETENNSKIHPYEEFAGCDKCSNDSEKDFFDFECSDCVELINDDCTSISQLMTIARQWNPLVQSNMNRLIDLMLQKGAKADDRDQLTDMTLLHFACKSGTDGIGDPQKSLNSVIFLIEQCQANPNLVCSFNDMTALHLAAYYDVASIVGYLVTVIDPKILNYSSKHLDSKTPLHITASNLCLRSARILLSSGANVLLKDDLMRTPLDCVPIETDDTIDWFETDRTELSLEMRSLLEEATLIVSGESNNPDVECLKTAKVVLNALGLEIGDKVIVGNAKIGTLRYCGPTKFHSGIWTGIELEEPSGKNDGSIDGVRYFICQPNYGIFAPINRITKLDPESFGLMMGPNCDSKSRSNQTEGLNNHNQSLGHNFQNVQSKIDTGLSSLSKSVSDSPSLSISSKSLVNSENIKIGSKVFLVDKKTGIVKFIGTTKFASGIWYGIELTRPVGKNDGSVQNVRYFHCRENYGIFVPFSRIAKILRSTKNSTTSQDVSGSEESDLSLNISGSSSLDLFNYNNHLISNNEMNSSRISNLSLKTSPNSNGRISTIRRAISLSRSMSMSTGYRMHRSKIAPKENSLLREGVNVLVNGMIGCIRYIGPVHFADGIFLGIELRNPTGKNDGSVEGKRYFTCKPNHGILVRPKKVTIRGINAADLVKEDNG